MAAAGAQGDKMEIAWRDQGKLKMSLFVPINYSDTLKRINQYPNSLHYNLTKISSLYCAHVLKYKLFTIFNVG